MGCNTLNTKEKIKRSELELKNLKSILIKEKSITGLGYYNGVPILPITLPIK